MDADGTSSLNSLPMPYATMPCLSHLLSLSHLHLLSPQVRVYAAVEICLGLATGWRTVFRPQLFRRHGPSPRRSVLAAAFARLWRPFAKLWRLFARFWWLLFRRRPKPKATRNGESYSERVWTYGTSSGTLGRSLLVLDICLLISPDIRALPEALDELAGHLAYLPGHLENLRSHLDDLRPREVHLSGASYLRAPLAGLHASLLTVLPELGLPASAVTEAFKDALDSSMLPTAVKEAILPPGNWSAPLLSRLPSWLTHRLPSWAAFNWSSLPSPSEPPAEAMGLSPASWLPAAATSPASSWLPDTSSFATSSATSPSEDTSSASAVTWLPGATWLGDTWHRLGWQATDSAEWWSDHATNMEGRTWWSGICYHHHWCRENPIVKSVAGYQRLSSLPPAPAPIQYLIDRWIEYMLPTQAKKIRALPKIGDSAGHTPSLSPYP